MPPARARVSGSPKYSAPNNKPRRFRTVPTYHSRPAGDVVLAVLPPYLSLPWMGAGLPLLSTLLEQAGVTTRLVRFLDDPYDAPREVIDQANLMHWTDAPLEVRASRMREISERNSEFFDLIMSRLLAGPERVFGFSVWRINADVVLEVTRRLKEARPDAYIMLGGPEASEAPKDFEREWIDAVVTGAADGVVVSVTKSLLENRPTDSSIWENVWINPRLGPRRHLLKKKAESQAIPRIDYTRIVPLYLDDPDPQLPMLLNVGCPFHCSFCVNTTLYPELEWGNPNRVLDEMLEVSRIWQESFEEGEAPTFEFMMCDAALNGQPAQFDQLCELMIAADWPEKPKKIRGYFIIDGRINEKRAKLALNAGFGESFFGLETASPRLREIIKKPGSAEQVFKALQIIREAGEGKLRVACGIIVGWPDETEAEFYETIGFLDKAIALGVVSSVSVHPLFRTRAAMDDGMLKDATGDERGLCWSMPAPAGSAAVRARRFFHVFEHFSGVVRVESSLPTNIAVRVMFGQELDAYWTRWIEEHGYGCESATPPEAKEAPREMPEKAGFFTAENYVNLSSEKIVAPAPEAIPEIRENPFVEEFRSTFVDALTQAAGNGWVLDGVSEMACDTPAVVLPFRSVADSRTVGILVQQGASNGNAYARTNQFKVSYLPEFNGAPCTFDKRLMESLVAAIAARESAPQRAAG